MNPSVYRRDQLALSTPVYHTATGYRADRDELRARREPRDYAAPPADDLEAAHRAAGRRWSRDPSTPRNGDGFAVPALLDLSSGAYSALWCFALRAARQACGLAGVRQRPAGAKVGSADAEDHDRRADHVDHTARTDDELHDVATEAVTSAWAIAAKRGAEPARVFGLVRVIAKRLARRRSQWRIRMRDPLVQVTDDVMPATDAHRTLRELIALVPASRRASALAHLRELSGKGQRARDARRRLGATLQELPGSAADAACERASDPIGLHLVYSYDDAGRVIACAAIPC